MIVRVISIAALSTAAMAQNIGANFVSDYTYLNLGTPGTPLSWGGLNFKPGNNNVLLMGGYAYNPTGEIWEVPITRGGGGHITGFGAGAAMVATAPYVDGGLTFAPGNVLLFTGWPTNDLGQLKPGSTSPDRTDVLTSYGVTSSVGGACIVPAGFAGAGRLKLTSYSSDTWFDMLLTPDGNGTFAPGTVTQSVALPGTGYGGPEGITYVHAGAPGITVDSVVIAEYGEWQVAVYDINSNGDPVPATRQVLLDNIVNAEGIVLDPVTGDFVVCGQSGEFGLIQRISLPPTPYCTAGTTTHGCLPSISGTGTPDANAGSGFTISIANVEGQKSGILFYGITGTQATPWGLGSSFICVKAPTQRMGTQTSGGTLNGCDGSLSIDWNTFITANPTSLGCPYSGGETVWAQGWFRDPPSPKTTNLSNALQFSVQP
jgi:hypothetical protein